MKPKISTQLLGSMLVAAAVLLAGCSQPDVPATKPWTIAESPNSEQPGRQVDVRHDGELIARLIYGEGQMKPYLHVFGVGGERLTKGEPEGRYPHHRGIFIGWNRIHSDLGVYDLWHLNKGGRMTVANIDRMDTTADAATIVATIEWRGGSADATGNDLLLTETRTLTITRPQPDHTQIDAHFRLHAARDLRLDGDLQHAGIHFRAAQEVSDREKETSYLTAPDGVVAGDNLQWCRFLFPIGERWYSALQMNAPGNPVEELSMRAYGRFGYFFKRSLARDETMDVHYRFVIQPSDIPAQAPAMSPAQAGAAREQSARLYRDFAGG